MTEAINPYKFASSQDEWMRKNGLDPERVRRLAAIVGSSVREDDNVDPDDD